MKYALTDFCVCPRCRGDLAVQGADGLLCRECEGAYAIRDEIPILLPEYRDEEYQRYLASYERLASDDLQAPIEHRRNVRHSVLIDFIGDVRGRKVLDIGSSAGTYLRQLDAEFSVALDLVYAYVAAIPRDDRVARVCGDAECLPFKPGFFDVVIISDALEHFLKPELVIERLRLVCRPDTRIIVHVPWEEDISAYRDGLYEFAHLRSFTSYTFAQLWRDFYIKRMRSTYPSLEEPVIFKLDGRIPSRLYCRLVYWYFHAGLAHREYEWRSRWIAELPRRERWLLYFYRPKFRMFELRNLYGVNEGRFLRTVRRLFRGRTARAEEVEPQTEGDPREEEGARIGGG